MSGGVKLRHRVQMMRPQAAQPVAIGWHCGIQAIRRPHLSHRAVWAMADGCATGVGGSAAGVVALVTAGGAAVSVAVGSSSSDEEGAVMDEPPE